MAVCKTAEIGWNIDKVNHKRRSVKRETCSGNEGSKGRGRVREGGKGRERVGED